ncbi:MAG: NAD(P)/FAD-dependent oxidoreductase [Alphaproteobacteria bacterium]|nr:NAD(P)/FAD-dependent oxidoreductase [Alphaproteobacteria bacterium]
MSHQHRDVAIIGAGPVGLFAIFECGMMGLKCHVVDALDAVGGQCTALYPEKPIYDIPAYPKILGGELIENLKKQADPFNPSYHLGQQVLKMKKDEEANLWQLETSLGERLVAKTILIAAGVGAFGPNRPPLEKLEEFEGKSVFYYVKSREDFRGKNIVIAGGGDSAVDWALSLSKVAKKVSVVHRRPKFRAAPESESQLHALAQKGIIDLVIPFQLDALSGNAGKLERVIVRSLDGERRELEADCLLPFYGLAMDLGPIAHWGLQLNTTHIQIDPRDCSTNIPGIFAVGDIAYYSHKLKLILTGFSEAAQAAHAIRAFVHPGEVYHFEYSTTSGVPAPVIDAA